jgi:signal transduction histidine kinase
MKFFLAYLKGKETFLVVSLVSCVIFGGIFALYGFPLESILYPLLICMVLWLAVGSWDFYRQYQKHKKLEKITQLSAPLMDGVFPEAESWLDADYQQIIELLRQEQLNMQNQMNLRYADMTDYYTIWAHQIKTPIASMRLTLQNEDSPLSRQLTAYLFRIEQYVEMALMFLRLDSDSTDYVFELYDLDTIVKGAVKKYAGEFIGRRLKLEYAPLNVSVLTDEKWLSFVIEQILSNALKYTHSGGISITLEEKKTLCIRDTGIGIRGEDLPRIFEKGYTGYNGRSDKKASGIGLYLCRKICGNLGHGISVESVSGVGTVVRLDLEQRNLEVE